ncbi:acyl-CoA dehydratase activase [Desulfonatronovibrio hydrogenovorans]|uniref:acyl-CoA dehydratase activase n=1 Tax=Desulfonatronovibrio hydrogenovorans TaxID=53245 RepID=UPI0005542CA0|nr:acyl-CoA dehydratase activase [Desulfonatronovibrio hydrogenovorans]
MQNKQIAGDVAGLDIGSRSIELVVLQNRTPVYSVRVSTTYDPLKQCRLILNDIRVQAIVATGYGRKLFAEHSSIKNIQTITEIQAYALGVSALFPNAGTILDIGGQDTKAISLTAEGRVMKFEMNDRCAAGTGKFLEYMALALQIPMEEFGSFALRGKHKVPIGSMCTVFAETEATSLMARGEKPENIALGLHEAIAQRTMKMLNRIGLTKPLVFAGGVAHNPCMVRLIQEKTDSELLIPSDPDTAGAYGAAIYGLDNS